MTQRIALATISMNKMAGGLERNIAYLANYLCEQGVEVHLLTFDLPGGISFYELDKRIIWHMLGTTKPHQGIGFWERLKLILNMRKVLSMKPSFSHVICFSHGLLIRYYLATLFCGIRLICSERNSLTMYRYIKSSKWNKNFLMLHMVDGITVQFQSYIQEYPLWLRSKIEVVHNPVFPVDSPEFLARGKIILSVGRHSAQKRFDLLIRACQIVFKKYPDWLLWIVGDGPLTSSLEELIKELNCGDRIQLLPPRANIDTLYSKARFYCQPSQWEGFPNAQAEAMAAGMIPIGFSSTSGVSDLIEDRVNGYLCSGDVSAEQFADTLITAIENTQDHENISQTARRITQVYSVESWRRSWSNILSIS